MDKYVRLCSKVVVVGRAGKVGEDEAMSVEKGKAGILGERKMVTARSALRRT